MEDTCSNGESASDPDGSGDEGEDPSHTSSEFFSDPSGSRQACTCGFCDGFEVDYTETDPHSGEVEDRSFKKASQKERCPRCGGYNLNWRQRFIAHCASVGKRLGRKRHVYFVSFALIRSAADDADLGTKESYEVLMKVWDRVRREINSRGKNADYHGVVAPRPSDERHHGHLLIYTSLTRYELMRAFHSRGLDAFIQMPKDDADTPENFAARKGAYVWENTASSSKARHIASQGSGTGYNSREARRRRQKAVSGGNGEGENNTPDGGEGQSPSAPSLNRNGRGGKGGNGHGGDDPGKGNSDPNRRKGWSRAPPVNCRGGCYSLLDNALASAKAAFTKRVGTRVSLLDEGEAHLLKVHREGDQLMCVIAPVDQSTTTKVSWGEVHVANPPTIRVGSKGKSEGSNNGDETRGGSGSGGDRGNSKSEPGEGNPSSGNDEGDNDGEADEPDGADPNGDGGSGGNGTSGENGNSGGENGDGSDKDDPSERFEKAADKSIVQTQLPSQKRLKTTFNYSTGKARASVLPRRHQSTD